MARVSGSERRLRLEAIYAKDNSKRVTRSKLFAGPGVQIHTTKGKLIVLITSFLES